MYLQINRAIVGGGVLVVCLPQPNAQHSLKRFWAPCHARGQGQVPSAQSAAGVYQDERKEWGTGRRAKSDLEKKYMRLALWEKLNLRVHIQFHSSGVKSDKSSWPPSPTKRLAIQVFSSLPHNRSRGLQRATMGWFLWECCTYSAFSSRNLAFIYQIA